MINFIFILLINVFDVLLCSIYMRIFYIKITNKYWLHILVGVSCSLLLTYVNVFISNTYINFICVIFCITMISLLFEQKNKSKYIINLLYILVRLTTNTFSSIILKEMYGEDFTIYFDNIDYHLYFLVIVNEILHFAIINLICKIKQYNSEKITLKISILFNLIPILSLFLIFTIIETLIQLRVVIPYLYFICTLSILYINILIFYLFEIYNKLIHENLTKTLMEKENNYKDEYYKKLEENQKEIRLIRHNLKNQLIVILHLLKDKNYTEAIQSIESIISNVQILKNKIYTNNRVVNAIITNKLEPAISTLKISLKIDIKIPDELNINAIDLGIIIGNLLDNAIEACEKVKDDRYIQIDMGYHKDNIVLEIQNSCTSECNKYHTTKKNKMKHGYGLVSVRNLVEKYNGAIEITCHDYCYNVSLVFKNEKIDQIG